MTIAVTCPRCNASFQVEDQQAGQEGKCPQCQGAIQVPDASWPPGQAGVAPESRQQRSETPARLQQEILRAFQGEMKRVRVPITYRLGVLLVAALMVILPLVYVALIGLVCGLMCLHLFYCCIRPVVVGGNGAPRMDVLGIVAPLAVGGILVAFMIKPLFARSSKPPKIRSLGRDGHPLLFAFVDRLCAAVRAPRPGRIDVDCQVNASASFRRGPLNLLRSDLVLTIGLPLVAGLSLRQFAGVLAHEFGHFSQGAGMRLTYVIRSISWWFTRVVYERDEWDEKLIRGSEDSEWYVVFVCYVARFFVWLTRRVLWTLMMIGHTVSGFMLRQMELDADRHQARLAGSDAFEATVRRLAVLDVASQRARADLGTFYQEGRLGDNLPRLIMANVDEIPPEVDAKIKQMIDQSTTGLFDTHPADKDRIASVRRENAPGIFRLERPSSGLFSDFDGLCRHVTWDFYCEVFGPQFKPGDMHPIDDLLARQSKEQEAGKALRRYFQGAFNTLRPLPLPAEAISEPVDGRQCAAQVEAARQRMVELAPAYRKAFAAYDEADRRALETDLAAALLKANFTVRPADFSRMLTTVPAIADVRQEAAAQQRRVETELAEFEEAAAERLFGALPLLHVPHVAEEIENAREKKLLCHRILLALRFLNEQSDVLLELRSEHAALGILARKLEGDQRNAWLIHGIRVKMAATVSRLQRIRCHLATVAYPLDHARGEISIGQYLLPEIPDVNDLGEVFDAGQAVVETWMTLYARLVARLAAVAEEVEQVLGLEPLPKPPEEDASPAAGGPAAP